MPSSFSWTLTSPSPVESLTSAELTGASVGRDLELDADDELLMVNGDLVLVAGVDAVAQSLKIGLRFFKGEFFRDESVGLPFFDEILVKNPNMIAVRSILRSEILSHDGVEDVTSLTLDYVSSTRTATVEAEVLSDLGELIVIVPVEV